MDYVRSVFDLCGDTPIVQLNRMAKYQNVFLKLESFNPGKSVKDRPVIEMLKDAEKSGRLRTGMTIVESTSGNTGIALALYGKKKGYRVICVADENIPREKLNLLKAYGAEVEMVEGTINLKNADLTEYRIKYIRNLIADNKDYINLSQYDNVMNPHAHEMHTAKEILTQINQDIKAIVISVGTGGTITGVSKGIKDKRPDLLIYGVEPVGSTLFGGEKGPYLQQGPGNYFKPKIFNTVHVDNHEKVNDYNAFKTARDLATKEGLLLGGSSGAVVYAAIKIANQLKESGGVLAVCPDNGTKYLDTIFNDEWLKEHNLF
ncbi:cysteine synthase family protein [Bacillus toyonensis]|nr:cysteine synthase family protein [Bacillus toyonensis]